jgi:hypothetical protein
LVLCSNTTLANKPIYLLSEKRLKIKNPSANAKGRKLPRYHPIYKREYLITLFPNAFMRGSLLRKNRAAANPLVSSVCFNRLFRFHARLQGDLPGRESSRPPTKRPRLWESSPAVLSFSLPLPIQFIFHDIIKSGSCQIQFSILTENLQNLHKPNKFCYNTAHFSQIRKQIGAWL